MHPAWEGVVTEPWGSANMDCQVSRCARVAIVLACVRIIVSSDSTRILSTSTRALFEAAVTEATAFLRRGEVVALPTETVYGLAANAFDPAAVERVYRAKGRPADNPLIVHVADLALARRCVGGWPELAQRLARAFWPGPLTLVLPRSERIAANVTAGGSTVGVRWPSHPFIQAVIRSCGFPLAAPSANRSTEVSPTSAEHVRRGLGGQIPLIVDGGTCQVGIESTVVDLSSDRCRILRPGMIHAESIVAVAGDLDENPVVPGRVLASPGLLEKHYAPRARVLVLSWRDDEDLAAQIITRHAQPATTFILAHSVIPSVDRFSQVRVIPHDPDAFGRALYAEWHDCDEAGAAQIVVEAVPTTGRWAAIADRLRRASH
jgi:L-threonylcarbamoyladenylate synthase